MNAMSNQARAYMWSVFVGAGVLSWVSLPVTPILSAQWQTLAALTLMATIAQLFPVEAPKEQTYFVTSIFFFAGILLLDPLLVVLMVVVAHLVEWAKERWIKSQLLRSWYGQPFNIAKHSVVVLCTAWVYGALNPQDVTVMTPYTLGVATVAVLTFVGLNQLLGGLALLLARRISLRASGVFRWDNLISQLALGCLGYVVAVEWHLNLWLVPPTLAPLWLSHRALATHKLKEEAQIDAKTGLWNSRHFAVLFASELNRAKRFNRPLTVLMADLDRLRDINNTYGHLAGDAVLAAVGTIIHGACRDYDIAGRFGGEEFTIVLPEVERAEAEAIAERLREAIAATPIPLDTAAAPIHVTISIGLACFPEDAATTDELIHAADVAVYQAKFLGRNRVVSVADIPHSMTLEHASAPEGTPQYAAAFLSTRNEEADATLSTADVAQSPVPAGASYIALDLAPGQLVAAAEGWSQVVDPGAARAFGLAPWLKQHATPLLGMFIVVVVATAAAVALLGVQDSSPAPLTIIMVFTALAIIAEVFQIDVYGDSSMSVSMALIIATAMIGGMPGLLIISAGVVVADHLRKRPIHVGLHKTAFNGATHVLAGAIAVFGLRVLALPLDVAYLPWLVLFAAVASLAYYVIETCLISVAISLSQWTSVRSTWEGQFRWLAGHYLVLGIMGMFLSIAYMALGILGMVIFVLPVLMLRYTQKQYVERTEASVYELKRMNQELAEANHVIVAASRAIHLLNDELFLTVGTILDARDPSIGSHATQVATYAVAIATELGLPPERTELVRQAGFLHDIGKIAIPEQVLNKPGKLTAQEYEQVKTHAPIGGQLLEGSPSLRHLAPFVQSHHECWDGRGYPHGLRGEEIPLEARILNVCDSVEAMTSDRPYQPGKPLPEVIAEVRRCSGTQFDPVIAEIFVKLAERQGARLVINTALEAAQNDAKRQVGAAGDHAGL